MKHIRPWISQWMLVALLLACQGAAQAAPDYFYRIDDRGPDDIFQNGFRPWGSNNNLLDHLEGTSCLGFLNPADGRERERSNYISVTQNEARARTQAFLRLEQMTRANAPGRVWRYLVRPTGDTYNAARTMEATGMNLQMGRLRRPYLNALTGTEWVHQGHIGTELIRGAEQFEMVNGQAVPVRDTYIENPRYVVAAMAGNPSPLPRDTMDLDGHTRSRAMIGFIALISACFCNTRNSVGPALRSRVPSGKIFTGEGAACRDQIQYINDVIPQIRYTPPKGPTEWEL